MNNVIENRLRAQLGVVARKAYVASKLPAKISQNPDADMKKQLEMLNAFLNKYGFEPAN